MRFSHLLLTRPLEQSLELQQALAPLGADIVVQPAFEYFRADIAADQAQDLQAISQASADDLLIFTSPRAVEFGLPQMPGGVLGRARVAAVGPATERALNVSGVRSGIRSGDDYTSEALLASIDREVTSTGSRRAFIFAAPGGRTALADGLRERGFGVHVLMVYRSEPAKLDREALKRLESASRVLSVWTSGNTMKGLSQRLPPAAWFRVCQGEWLVISARLERLARAYGPDKIHRSQGPGNAAIASALKSLS